jgi:hypothetical protein
MDSVATEVGATRRSSSTSLAGARPVTTPSRAWRPNGIRTTEPTSTPPSGSR